LKKHILFVDAKNPSMLVENLYPPLWPAFLAAYAERELRDRLEFRYCSRFSESALQRPRPDLVAISSVTQNYNYAIRIAEAAKRLNLPVLLGGMHISSLPSSLTDHMDVACLGEGEETFVDLLKLFIEEGKLAPDSLQNIPGIAFYHGGQLIVTQARRHLQDINNLPHPKRNLIGYGRRGYVYSARGCPYQCVFCSCNRFWGKVRYASADYILEELEELIRNGAKVVRFADENFVSNIPRLEEIAEKIRFRGLNSRLRFSCWCRANNLTAGVIKTLKSMNIVSVKLGLESGNQRILDYLKGGVTVEQNELAIRMLKEAGIQANSDFIFGIPDETPAEIADTYNFIRRSQIDLVEVNIFSPLPGTPVWNDAKAKGLVDDRRMDWSRLNYKFRSRKNGIIHMSNMLSHRELKRVHRRFQRLRVSRFLRALPKSPWLHELPAVLFKYCQVKAVSVIQRLMVER
jgi:anaerobic magnesium-protoporphyrin IX monomethyl ester cyclase